MVIDITNQRYGRLVVVARDGSDKKGHALWECKCDCGKRITVRGDHLRRGATQSCGCYMREKAKKQHKRHGETGTRLYSIWCNMKKRCDDQKYKSYPNYGAKGIKVCPEWSESFEAFRDWSISNGYRDDLTIDRIDVYGNYEPENCRWSTMLEQQNNRGNNRVISFRGVSKTVSQWAKETGISEGTIRSRLDRGWPADRVLADPVNKKHIKNIGGITHA